MDKAGSESVRPNSSGGEEKHNHRHSHRHSNRHSNRHSHHGDKDKDKTNTNTVSDQPEIPDLRKRFLTKRVPVDWYLRYTGILEEHERTDIQPLKELKGEQAMMRAMHKPLSDNDRAMQLSDRMNAERDRKIKLVMQILDGNIRNIDLTCLKPTTENPLSNWANANRIQTLFLRQRVVRPPGYLLSKTSKWRVFWEDPAMTNRLKALIHGTRRDKVVARWRKAVRLLYCVFRFNLEVLHTARTTERVFKQFKEADDNRKSTQQQDHLNYQKNYFRATSVTQQLNLSTLFILSKSERHRTPQEIESAVKAMRVIKSFAEFPAYMQKIIGTVAWYTELDQDKIIIRQGQPPNSFYFLLSGRVAEVRTDANLKKDFDFSSVHSMGVMLGSEGIFNLGEREYTLCCLERCKLIGVGIDDFHRTCLREGAADHLSFLSQLNFMKFFPMWQLVENPMDNIMLFYYKEDRIVTANTEKSHFIFIILKGSCKVIGTLSRRIKCSQKVIVPRMRTVGNIESADSIARTPSVQSPRESKTTPDVDKSNIEPVNSIPSTPNVQSPCESKTTPEVNKNSIRFLRKSLGINSSKMLGMMDSLTKHWGKGTMASTIRNQQTKLPPLNPNLMHAGSVEMLVRAKSQLKTRVHSYVHLKTLREGDVIGLEYMDFGDPMEHKPLKTAVVSEGAEVVAMSKEFIIKNMSEFMRKDLRAGSYLFPTDAQIRTEQERKRTWRKLQMDAMRHEREEAMKTSGTKCRFK